MKFGVVFITEEVSVTHRDRLENWSLDLIWLQGPDYCPLMGLSPGLLLAYLLDITSWEDVYIWWGYATAPFVGNVAMGRKLHSTFCESTRLWPHSGIRIWVPSFWTRRTLGYWFWGPSGTLLKEQGSLNQVQIMGHKGPVLRSRWVGSGGARTPFLLYIILFFNCCFTVHFDKYKIILQTNALFIKI
jgi:hypothetical protein